VFNVGTQELLIILLLVFILFGPRHIPEVAHALGKGLGDIRKALTGVEDGVRRATGDFPRLPRTLDQLAELASAPKPEEPRRALRSLEEMPPQMLNPTRAEPPAGPEGGGAGPEAKPADPSANPGEETQA
jgi:sec-independent protein translocase protein TatA